ncbi:ferritin [Candidatus Woesearchaeota archaeon]|nr:ferritin [Candidatus Woesearchaeota archaeon]
MVIEDRSKLSDKTMDMKRAIDSLREEMDAIDLYNQRADACTDAELKGVLLHNAKEEKEHAAMLIEWIRRNDPEFDHEVKDYVGTDKPLSH